MGGRGVSRTARGFRRADGDRRLPPPQVRYMSNTCPLLLPRSRAYRYRGLDCLGVGGRERRPAAAVTEAGAEPQPRTARPVPFQLRAPLHLTGGAQPPWRSAASRLRPHYGDARGVGDGDHRVGVSVVNKRRSCVDGVDPINVRRISNRLKDCFIFYTYLVYVGLVFELVEGCFFCVVIWFLLLLVLWRTICGTSIRGICWGVVVVVGCGLCIFGVFCRRCRGLGF